MLSAARAGLPRWVCAGGNQPNETTNQGRLSLSAEWIEIELKAVKDRSVDMRVIRFHILINHNLVRNLHTTAVGGTSQNGYYDALLSGEFHITLISIIPLGAPLSTR